MILRQPAMPCHDAAFSFMLTFWRVLSTTASFVHKARTKEQPRKWILKVFGPAPHCGFVFPCTQTKAVVQWFDVTHVRKKGHAPASENRSLLLVSLPNFSHAISFRYPAAAAL